MDPGRPGEALKQTMRLLALLVSAAVLAACGADDAPTGDELTSSAEQIAMETRELAEAIAATGRQLAEDPDAREDAVTQLEQFEAEARDLADRARSELPDDVQAREPLVEANELAAEAAADLQRFSDSGEQAALGDARAALDDVEDRVRRAAEGLQGDLEGEAQDRLDELREDLPDIPQP